METLDSKTEGGYSSEALRCVYDKVQLLTDTLLFVDLAYRQIEDGGNR